MRSKTYPSATQYLRKKVTLISSAERNITLIFDKQHKYHRIGAVARALNAGVFVL